MARETGVHPRLSHTKGTKMVLDTSLLNTQQFKVWIKGKVEQSRERSLALPSLGCSSYRKGALGSPSTTVTKFTFTFYFIIIVNIFSISASDTIIIINTIFSDSNEKEPNISPCLPLGRILNNFFLSWGFRGWGGRTRAEARVLLVNAGHRIKRSNVSLC